MARSVDSLGVQKQLNAMFERRLDIESRVLDTMQQELKIATQLQAVMSGLSTDQLVERLNAGAKAMEQMAEKAVESGDIGAVAMKKISEGSDEANKKTGLFSKTLGGISSVLKSIISAAAGVAGSMFKIGKAILSIPLSIFKNLMADAAAMGGDTSFMEALEAVRKEFGSFKEDVSKNILGAYKTVNSELQQMTGLSVWQVFGTPAEQLKYLHEIATKAGAQMHQFGEEISKSGGAIAAFDKGMGIGAENLRSFMVRATVMGSDLQKQLLTTANYALQMGKDFGVSSKMLSRDVGVMMKDIKNFGSLTQKEMTIAAVYTKKLGIEMKDVLGVVDKFDNFDKAAESAALLSQAFGANVDAFKMMNEQNPAKRVDELRASMAAAGKSTENMSRQELKLLASTTGLSEEAAQLAFSTKNQGVSYSEIEKKASKAENAQIKQADALQKLADSIERVVRSGGQMHGSFFKMFFAGMEQGIKWSDNYRGAMMKVRQSLMETFMAGRKVGTAFAQDQTLGFGKFMFNFGETFSPKNVRKVLYGFKNAAGVEMGGVVSEMTKVFKGTQTFEGALTNIRKTFKGAVDPTTLKNMVDGGKDMMRFMAKGIGSGSAFIIKELISVLRTVTDFIKNPKEFLKRAGAAADGSKSFGAELIGEIAKSFGDPKLLNELKSSLLDFGRAIAKRLKQVMKNPEVQHLLMELGAPLLGAFLGPSLLKMLPTLIKPLAGPLMRGLSTALGGALGAATGVGLAAFALTNVNKKMDEYENSIDKRFDKASRRAGAYGASMLQGLTLGMLPDDLSQTIGASIAELADGIFKAIEKQFGGPFTSKLKAYFMSYTSFLGSVGGLMSAILSGNSGSITAEATKVGESLVTLVSTGFDFLITEFPKILVKLSSVLNTVLGSLLVAVGKGLNDFGDKIPIIGFAFKGLGIVVTGFGEILKDMGKFLDGISEKAKNFDLSATLGKAFDEIKLKFVDLGLSILSNIPGPLATLLGISDKGRSEMMSRLADTHREITTKMAKTAESASKTAWDAYIGVEAAAKATAQLQANTATAAGGTVGTPTPGLAVQQAQVDIASLISQKKTLEDNIGSLVQFAEGGIMAKLNSSLPKAATQLEDFNSKLSTSALSSTLNVTANITKSINELNAVLGDGNSGALKIGEKLQRFANNSGLGKQGKYEINNKGIHLKLDLKIVMDAGEVEKAIVLRKDSILFDQLFDKQPGLSQEHEDAINRVSGMKGGG